MRFDRPANWTCVALVGVLTLVAATRSYGQDDMPILPALTDPPSEQSQPGKFVWADLFTSDMDVSRRFYETLFGWTWSNISDWPRPYGIFKAAGFPVAGMAHRPPPSGDAGYGRWVHYLSVPDVPDAIGLIKRRTGRVLLAPQTIADRGEFAVVTGPDDAIFGLLHSTSGDPPDYRAEAGEWIWFQLFTHEPRSAAGFYRSLVGYEFSDRPDNHGIVDLVLTRGDYARASIGALNESSDVRPTWLGFIRVTDVQATTAQVRELGGEILYQSAQQISDLAIIADPNGATLGLLRWDYPATAIEVER